MRRTLDGRRRTVLASGALFAVAVLTTAAAFTDYADVNVAIDGKDNTFDIVAAGSSAAGWQPSDSDWAQGNPEAYRIHLTEDGRGYPLAPGGRLELRVAAKNASPKLAGALSVRISDPNPQQDAVDPGTGRYLELFDQLNFSLMDGDVVVMDHVPASELQSFTWDAALEAGEVRLLDVVIELPESVDNRWQQASTDVQFSFEAVNV